MVLEWAARQALLGRKMETKVCSKCGEEKEVGEFFKRNASKDGLTPRCKLCIKVDQREGRKKEQVWEREGFADYQDYRKHRDLLLEQGLIRCRSCSHEKQKTEFYRDKTGYYQLVCRECRAVEAINKRKDDVSLSKCVTCGKPSKGYNCRNCQGRMNLKTAQRSRHTKSLAVEYKGGRCEQCGLIHHVPEVYDFHHRTAGTKEECISNLLRTKSITDEDLLNELDKCILVCRNCHRVIHQDALKSKKYPSQLFRGEIKKMAVDYKGGRCSRCKKTFDTLAVYDFHHINSKEKEVNIGSMLLNLPVWKELRKELDKCSLVCTNCHQIIHYEEKGKQ